MDLVGIADAGADGVDVRINQAGDDGAATKLNDACGGTCQPTYGGGVADGADAAVAYCQCLCRRCVVDDDFAIDEYGVWRGDGLRLRACDAGQCKEEKRKDAGEAVASGGPYWRCMVHSVSTNIALLPGGVRRLILVCL